MLIVGLTGNIAAGKSMVAQRLAALGATVIDADHLAREAVRPGTRALRRIVDRWGVGVLMPDGTLDRTALREIVFADDVERAALDAIVHPEVALLREEEVAAARARGDRLVVCDIPLLFEVGLEGEMDRVVLVDAPPEVRRERLIRDRGLSASAASAMMAAQMPSQRKRDRAHHLIDNDGTVEELDAKVRALHAELLRAAA
ncbi:MAG: dephospho-CoA kinase [Gemmatimonadales bacterium]|nr:dephospho-CoA kinase [Gemmatimonadales bacterium]